jgi:hypothetical protein
VDAPREPRGWLLRAFTPALMVIPSGVRQGRYSTDTSSDRLRLLVPDAAKALGISPEAVRNRLSRGTLESVKEFGTVYILIDREGLDMPTIHRAIYRVSQVRSYSRCAPA